MVIMDFYTIALILRQLAKTIRKSIKQSNFVLKNILLFHFYHTLTMENDTFNMLLPIKKKYENQQ